MSHGFAKDPTGQQFDVASMLGEGNEKRRRDEASGWMNPAHESFEASAPLRWLRRGQLGRCLKAPAGLEFSSRRILPEIASRSFRVDHAPLIDVEVHVLSRVGNCGADPVFAVLVQIGDVRIALVM